MEQALREARSHPREVVLLFSDEASFYRQPSQAWLWARMGRAQPRLPYSHRLVMDIWPVHFHPKALEALMQDPRLELISLPTYAPWLNAIEKLWRLLRQRVAHAHPCCDDFRVCREHLLAQMQSFAHGSQALLRYVGLSSQ